MQSKRNPKNLILKMLQSEVTVKMPSILVTARFPDNPTERRAIQRVLGSLTLQGILYRTELPVTFMRKLSNNLRLN